MLYPLVLFFFVVILFGAGSAMIKRGLQGVLKKEMITYGDKSYSPKLLREKSAVAMGVIYVLIGILSYFFIVFILLLAYIKSE